MENTVEQEVIKRHNVERSAYPDGSSKDWKKEGGMPVPTVVCYSSLIQATIRNEAQKKYFVESSNETKRNVSLYNPLAVLA